jgi:hypothetical protein
MPGETEVQEQIEFTNESSPSPEAKEAPVEFDRGALESKIADKFSKAFEDADDSVTDVDPEPAKDEAEEKPEVENEAEELVEEEKEIAKEKPEAAAPSGAPTLPAAYRRSLKAYEWTDEEIDQALKTQGDKFVQSAAKIHTTRAKEIAGFAQAGRLARQGHVTPQQDAPAAPAARQEATTTSTALKPVDTAALKKQYGEEALVDAIAGPVNKAIEEINRLMPVIQGSQKRQQQAELETLGRQIDSFFSGKEMESYNETYGKDSAKLTPEQLGTRQKVLEMADSLIYGSRQQGRPMGLEEAMTLAHDSIAGSVKEKTVRTAITKQLQQRERSVTIKPNGRTSSLSKPNASREDLEKATKARLEKAFA